MHACLFNNCSKFLILGLTVQAVLVLHLLPSFSINFDVNLFLLSVEKGNLVVIRSLAVSQLMQHPPQLLQPKSYLCPAVVAPK